MSKRKPHAPEFKAKVALEAQRGDVTAAELAIHNLFNTKRSLYSRANFKLNRAAALAEWRQLGTA